MPVLADLDSAAYDSKNLDSYIEEHFNELYDFFNWSTDSELRVQSDDIRSFITSRRLVLEGLPTSDRNYSFLAFLLDVSERLGLISGFKYLFEFLKGRHFNIGSRLEAAALYLINVRDARTLLERFDSIYALLQNSFEFEEDNVDKILTTVTNMYAKTILDYGEFYIQVVKGLQEKLKLAIANDEYSFLNHPLIFEILGVDLSDFRLAHAHIHSALDVFLRRGKTKGKEITGFIKEEKTAYVARLNEVGRTFADVRQLSVREHMSNHNAKATYYSLNRGTTIIDNESQLFGYLHSYGLMHFEKLQDAFATLPSDIFEKKLNLIDWGCGQGMAAISIAEYCEELHFDLNIEKIILVEPSELALKRASLHVAKFLASPNINTVHKELDDLIFGDIETKTGINIHLFSNILDIDSVSLTQLIKLIKESFSGRNYFVVVSPYVNDVKKTKIDSFINAFRDKRDFELYDYTNDRAGEWKGDWTRISRVFGVTLNFRV